MDKHVEELERVKAAYEEHIALLEHEHLVEVHDLKCEIDKLNEKLETLREVLEP